MLTYRGYEGKVEVDFEDAILHGVVLGISDIISFEGETIEELVKSFHSAVDAYIAACESEGVPAQRPYSGQFLLRLTPQLHRELDIAAKVEGSSLNQYVSTVLRNVIQARQAHNPTERTSLRKIR